MFNVNLSLAEKQEVISYLMSSVDSPIIPERYNISAMKRQCFKRLCAKFDLVADTLLLKSKNGVGIRREVICNDDTDRRSRIIALSHSEGHHGINREHRYISERYAGITREHVAEYVRSCIRCMKFEPIPKTEPLQPIIATRPFERLQIDLIDLKSHASKNCGFAYVANLVDCFSRYCFTKAIKEKTAEEVLKFLQETFATFGFPGILQSDNGKEFKNSLVSQFCSENGIKIIHGRPRHPQSQGKVERLNQTLARSLGKCCINDNPVWIDKLQTVTKRYNLAVHTAFNDTPFFAFFGRSYHSAGILIQENAETSENSENKNQERVLEFETMFTPEEQAIALELRTNIENETTNLLDSPQVSAIGNTVTEDLSTIPEAAPEASTSQQVLAYTGLVGVQQQRISQKNDRYSSRMVKRASVHARKSAIEIQDEVIIKDDHDSNPGTRRKKLRPLNSRVGKVLQIKANNSFDVDINGEVFNFTSNQLRKIWKNTSDTADSKNQE